MSEWYRGTIGELAKGYRGVTYSAGQLCSFQRPDTTTLLRSNNISSGQLNFEDIQIVPSRLVSEDQRLRRGDIAVCMSNGSKALVGKAAPFLGSQDERYTVGAFCSVFRPIDASASAFISFVFQSKEYRKNLDLALAGSAINNLRNVDLEAFGCDIPPSNEQLKIAEVLDTLDTTIHATEAIIVKLKAVKQGLLHDLLTRGIDANGELRPPQAEAPYLYKDSPLGWIPVEWDATYLGTVTTWASGGTPNRAIASNWSGDVPLLTPKDMKAFELSDTSEHINVGAAQSGSRLMPPKTVFIVVRGMILAHSFPVVLATRAMAFNQDIKAVSPGPRVDGRFLAHWFVANSDRFLRKVTEATHGTKKLDMENLLGMPIGLPPLAEQDRTVARQKAIDDQLEYEALSLSKLQTLKSGLMDDLLTGRVRVTPLLEAAAP